mmetsp:Transcript_9185/g.17484  ORF Transcript_9185/g.17484 Transcript_9185/m.17484 type:complete len:283 (+) Transcript_9185:147-995(+)
MNTPICRLLPSLKVLLLLWVQATALVNPFLASGKKNDKPRLVLIGGCPGTGKSTFGMSVALQEGILKCISTDTVRAVMRSFVPEDVSPALHRSSYAPAFEDDNPVRSWKECCTVLHASVETLVRDAIERRTSLVVEGVHLIPSSKLIKIWEDNGGVALGCLLQVTQESDHKQLLNRRGVMTGNMDNENSKIAQYERIRIIQDEMMKLADEAGWLRIEQRVEPDPLDMVASRLYGLVDQQAVRQQMLFTGQPTTSPPEEPQVTTSAGDNTGELLENGHTEEFA